MLENRELAVELFLINDMDTYVEQQQRLRTWPCETEFIFMAHLHRTNICLFSNTSKSCQVHSGKLLQQDFQLSRHKVYIDHKNKNHFEVVLSTSISRNQSNSSDTAELLLKSSVRKELLRQASKVNRAQQLTPFWKIRPKSKYQCSTSTEKVKKYRMTESESTNIDRKRKDKELKRSIRECYSENDKNIEK